MKGVILAGGNGTRLQPLTNITNKHLIAVYNKPMILYPLRTLLKAGIKDILIISGRGHAGHFVEFLGSGNEYGANFTYKVQDEAGGIADALKLCEDFADGKSVMVILGDNIFEDSFVKQTKSFRGGARIFLKKVTRPERFGVPELKGNNVLRIIEKPGILTKDKPPTSFAVTGIYIYDAEVFSIVKKLKPSSRGELEITDVNNAYIKKGKLKAEFVKGFWSDAGTFESLSKSSQWAEKRKSKV